MALNAKWHAANRMPEKATREQRIQGHARHAVTCGCRPPPASLAADVKKAMKKSS
jgi:hypothetical protein